MNIHFSGNIKKMRAQLQEPVLYHWELGTQLIEMNTLIGKRIKIQFENQINCTVCGNITPKAYGQGFCYTCFTESPENSECIVKPELCEGHLGKGRDAQWEYEHHVKEHYVYLALSSGVKVGVTRGTQVPTRWIDQGANAAIVFAKTPYRKLAGLIEVELKKYVTDKTNWQAMLKNHVNEDTDLIAEKLQLSELLPSYLKSYLVPSNEITYIHYPVISYPEKVNSLSLDKTPVIDGTLIGIKAQYLIFEGGQVFNIRNSTGYKISLEAN
ncbi:MAG: DUF2797 domain-containing protein [Flavobacteriales bacterium]|nr:DUF2797 domain-containing protein [Flavobacteriales bacterium]